MQDDYTPMKICSQCKQELPATTEYFHRSKKNIDGFKYACKGCRAKQGKRHRQARLERLKTLEVPIEPKVCITCNTLYPRTDEYWHKNQYNLDGYSNDCKECAKQRARTHWQGNGAEYERKRSERIRNDPEYAEKRRQVSRNWYEKNHEYTLAKKKQYYWQNRERFQERQANLSPEERRAAVERTAQWRKNNPKRYKRHNKAHKARRRELIYQAEGSHTADDIRRLYEQQAGRCGYCGIPLYNEYHLDHIVPLSKGGSNNPNNLLCTCAECNLSKGDKLVHEWEVWREW